MIARQQPNEEADLRPNQPQPEPEVRLLAGRYHLLRQVGQGSSATVYAATDTLLSRSVSVKLFDPSVTATTALRDRFHRQAAKAARLTHPHIATLLDAGLVETGERQLQAFVVTEPAGPGSLRALLDRRGPLDAASAVAIARQVAAALDYAHQHGLVHADVKPENVLLDPNQQAKVVDFSLSFVSATTGLVTPETLARRAAYLAPEQVRGEPVTPSTDVYGLGALLYECVAGRPPFVGATPEATAQRRVREHAQPAGNFDPSIPPALEAVIGRALQRAPEQRWPSAAAMAEALEALDPTRLRPAPLFPPVLDRSYAPRKLFHTPLRGVSSPLLVLGGLALLLTALVFILPLLTWGPHLTSLSSLTGGARRETPDVVGMSLENAQSLAHSRGVDLLVVGDRMSDNYPQGTIIQQSPVAGFQQTDAGPIRVTLSAGSTAPAPLSASQPAAAGGARTCQPGSAPVFVLGFANLKQGVGSPMGNPVECEHPDPTSGDIVQHTSTGLAYFRHSTNTPSFTDGWNHWALTDRGLVTWQGDAVDPPAD